MSLTAFIPERSGFAKTAAATAGLLALSSVAASAAEPNKGDTTWMLLSTILVILMTLPGLALFYGGLVRSKNVLSVMMQVLCGFSVIAILWVVYGYSVAFTANPSADLNPYFGGLSKMFLAGVFTADPTAGMSFANTATFSKGVVIPEMAFVIFQLTFAAITPALIIGAFAERMKFSAVMLFIVLWFTFAYLPMAHMVWFWAGPDAYTLSADNIDAVKAAVGEEAAKKYLDMLAAAGTDAAKIKEALDAYGAELTATAGFLFQKGAIDFAGGTVVHINSGIAGLVCAIMVGRRVGFGKENMAPHNLTMTLIGSALLFVGWFGFNAGSSLEANGLTALAILNTIVATAAAALAWSLLEGITRGHASLLGAASGVVAGLVAVTPAAGFVGPMGAIIIGLIAGVVCYWAVTSLKAMFKYDDSLDVFGIHGVGGIVGAILVAIFVDPALNGTGVTNYLATDASVTVGYDRAAQIVAQLWGVGTAVVWTAVVSIVALILCKVTVGLRVSEPAEREGLDITSHGERAYN